MAKTRRTRMSVEDDHRRVTRPRLRIIVKEALGYPTGYLRASSDTIQHGPESREVGYETSFFSKRLLDKIAIYGAIWGRSFCIRRTMRAHWGTP